MPNRIVYHLIYIAFQNIRFTKLHGSQKNRLKLKPLKTIFFVMDHPNRQAHAIILIVIAVIDIIVRLQSSLCASSSTV